MRTSANWRPLALVLAVATLLVPAHTAGAQYFGRNKVQYDPFHFRVVGTEHFDLYYYPAESLATHDAARLAERWYNRHLALLKQPFDKNPLIFYADPPDFQQSNVVEGEIGQGTGGVTEGMRDRVIMPFTGVYAENNHVLGHELVHVFQYHIAEQTRGGLANLDKIPLWLIEGMAEYLSLGRDDPNTAMWLRDALRRNDLPTIDQLTRDPRYFPYRYGQALWAYIGGVWGDDAINNVYRAALGAGWGNALKGVLGVDADSLSTLWHDEIRKDYARDLVDRAAPSSVGRGIAIAEHEGDQNVAPTVSPDGKYVAFFSSRSLFGMDLFVAEVATGRVIKQLTSVTSNTHYDALSFISSAGAWSPDAKQLAVVVFADGDNEIDLLDVASRRIVRKIHVPGIGAMNDPAWSPDGKTIAFSGIKGGISDLYLYDLASGGVQQLTNDREAQLQPAWSPDGRTIAFVTDAGSGTNFDTMQFGPMRLASMDVATREIRLLPVFGTGKAINPQYSPDGSTIYFVSDQDGVSDIYRMTPGTEDVRRVTRIATGVSGITSLSPTLSVARGTGKLVFSVFDKQGFSIRELDPDQALGTVVTPAESPAGSSGLLPPGSALALSEVDRSLARPSDGLPPKGVATPREYHSKFGLDYVGGPQVGVTTGGPYGTGPVGGVALGFSDVLNNNVVGVQLSMPGQVKDIGAEALYLNRTKRLNWGADIYHVPYLTGYANYDFTSSGEVYTQTLQRIFFDNAELIAQYPLSTTRRIELAGGFQRVSFNTEVDSIFGSGGYVAGERRVTVPSPPGLNFATASLAYVGDNSFFGFTSPIAGGRYRFEVAPYSGSLRYETLLADYRHYTFMRPFTLAFRAIHYGRYGRDAVNNVMRPLYVGDPQLVRGYDIYNFTQADCSAPANAADACPQFTRLTGSRVAAASVEFRIPLIGTDRFGLLSLPFLPTEIAPFIDAGAAWNAGDNVSWRFDRTNTSDRIPVFSAGITSRFNLLGFAVIEMYWVHPFQRLGRSSYFGFNFLPGW